MQNRDVLWAISVPFRMYNTRELDINKFVFTLSFDAALCDVSTARRIITIGLEKDLLSRANGILRIEFEFWSPKLLPPNWHPKFTLENIPMISLVPLETKLEYQPTIEKKIKRSEFSELRPLVTPKHVEIKKSKGDAEKKEDDIIPPTEKEKESPEPKKKPSSKKKKQKTKKKQQGQKSISDFFR